MTATETAFDEALGRYGVTRLAHFTPSLNLRHIIEDGRITSSRDLAENAPEYFSPTDRERFDGHPDKICCTFQYPNAYYLDQARRRPEYTNYPDWVCVLLSPVLVARPGALFSPRNAAAGRGSHLRAGLEGLESCFAERVGGYTRKHRHLAGAATDLQAEVLVPGPINTSFITAVVVSGAEQAAQEFSRLRMFGLRPERFVWTVSPELFDKNELRRRIHEGVPIVPAPWTPAHDREGA